MRDWHAAGQTMSLISGKWTFPVLAALAEQPKGYNELARAVGTDNKTLARTLTRLQSQKLVLRQRCGTQRVTYRLAPRGREIAELVDALAGW